jgi:hypothetical protein
LLESWKSWRFESSVVVVFGVTESFVEVTVAISSRKEEEEEEEEGESLLHRQWERFLL